MRGQRSFAASAVLACCVALTAACVGPADPAASPSPTGTHGVSATPTTPSAPPTTAAPTTPATTAPTPAPTATDGAGAPPPATPASTNVTVTFAGWNATTGAVEVGAYAETVTSGATCTLTLQGPGGRTAVATASGSADAATTVCELLAVPRSDLAAGTWSGTVDFASTERSGRADVPPMEVP